MVASLGDTFGRSSHVIPALDRKCVEGKERGDRAIEVWGTGNATREFLYVEDAAEANLLAARYNRAEPVNTGTGQEIPIRELGRLIAEIVRFNGEILWDTSKPDDQPRRCLDVSRAAQGLDSRRGRI